MSDDEIERVQRFESEDEQRAAALRFAREVVESRGHPSDESLEEARELVTAKAADLNQKADLALIFKLSPSGTEELEESRKLHG
jgi:hypothetical protein